ncbi:DnaA regulatory inactivator Hda [Azospira sp. I13]|uniref:DnaA regulatory inactivator Hda n=1 Tax=Azospira sp. I13 TaxID=1765050 RepID=UPI001F1BA5E3|nr:DnaA regulatory inactivator Hda [Azospira sp. I13]
MRQLLLDLMPESPPSLANFVPDGNEEALAALADWFSGAQPLFLLWGEAGSGKSHLLQASGLLYVDGAADADLAAIPPETDGLAVDNVQALSDAGQIALFNHFNRLRLAVENGLPGKLLVAAEQPPAALAVREDLRTRLGSALIFRLRPLSDAEKLAALSAQAADRGLKLSREALNYLMNRSSRDMRNLSALLAALDRYSLEHQRPITLPLLREVLQHAGDGAIATQAPKAP